METRGWLRISMALNLGLAAALGMRLAHWTAPGPFANPALLARTNRSGPQRAPASRTPARSELGGLHWSQVESEEYPRYIANLRAWGCPERLLHDIVTADVGALFESRRAALPPLDLPPWAGATRREAARRAQRQAIHDLESERRALLRTLLGLDDVQLRLPEWRQRQDFWHVVNFLPEETARQVFALTRDCQEAIGAIWVRADRVVLDEDREQARACLERYRSELQARLTAAQFEEYCLRLAVTRVLDLHIETIGLSGLDVRDLARLCWQHSDPMAEIVGAAVVDPDLDPVQREAAFDRGLADFLGPERHAEYRRAQNSDYRDLFALSREAQLPPETARNAFAVQTAAEAEAQRIDDDPTLDPLAQAAARGALYIRTYAQFEGIFGAERLAAFVEDHAWWLTRWRPEPAELVESP